MTANDFATSVERLLNQVGHWEQSHWSAPARAGARSSVPAGSSSVPRVVPAGSGPTKADSVYALVQDLADLAADTEGNPRRPVPRMGDLTLPDQLRVMSDDLLAAGPSDDAFTLATDEVNATRHAL